MDSSDMKALYICVIAIFVIAWAGGAYIASGKFAVEKAAIEHGYVQKRVGADLLWVKE